MDAASQTVLQDVFRRASRSLLQYVHEAYPWVSDQDRDMLAQLDKLIAEERHAAVRLADYLRRHRIALPYLGSYPNFFTTINYVSLDRLLPLLAQHQRRAIADLERDVTRVRDPEVRVEVDKMLGLTRRHLETLDHLTSAQAHIPAA